MSVNGTTRTSGDVRLGSAKCAKADIEQVAVTKSLVAAGVLAGDEGYRVPQTDNQLNSC
jgi:hypothetical protein